MSGPKPSYPIALSAAEERQLRHLARAHKTAQSEAVRAKILLTAHEHPDWSNQAIASHVGTTDRTVRKWRARWVATHSLADAPRSGAPRRYGPEVRATTTAVACSLPRAQGVSLSRWSRTAIARHIRTQFVSTGRPAPSARTIGRWLKSERIRPWRYHSWQHIHDLEAFEQRARPVLQLYAAAHSLLANGTWLLCLDEKTSIQARNGEAEPRPAAPDHPQLQESRYKRKGAKHLFAAFSVADGEVFGQTHDRKRFLDFQVFITETIIPQALARGVQLVQLILDNGTTHAPKQLEHWLQQLPEVQAGLLAFRVSWLPTNASWLDQMEIWFSILQRKLLSPNHFINLDDLCQAINAFITYYNQEAKPLQWTYTVEKLEHKLELRKKQQEYCALLPQLEQKPIQADTREVLALAA